MRFPIYRPRRLRRTEPIRNMVRETRLAPEQLILPLFARWGEDKRVPVPSMPGVFQLSIDKMLEEIATAVDAGVTSVLLFGLPKEKDPEGSEAYDDDGIIQRAVRIIKDNYPDLIIITDVCLCEYTSHGHCGLLKGHTVDNDATLELLAKSALSHARAGADIVAPSDMMDGRVEAIRSVLDEEGFEDTAIMAYSAKYCSAFYGPFRDAADSAPQFGDRRSYQMDPANADEALRETAMDIDEGADMVMVKPAGPYLDIIRRVKAEFGYPLAAYQVSGEYAMIKAAVERGWLDENRVMMESLIAIKRAGADMIITYYATEAARLLKEG